MNLKASIAASLLGLLAAAGCSSGSSPAVSDGAVASTSTTIAPAKWTAEAKSGVRQLMAMAYQAPQLDCALDVIVSIYTPEDWSYAVGKGSAELTGRAKELEDRSVGELDRRCGIKDTRAEDKAKADAMDAWNAAVEEWNTLTKARDAAHQADVVVDGRSFESYDDWAKAFGKPSAPPS